MMLNQSALHISLICFKPTHPLLHLGLRLWRPGFLKNATVRNHMKPSGRNIAVTPATPLEHLSLHRFIFCVANNSCSKNRAKMRVTIPIQPTHKCNLLFSVTRKCSSSFLSKFVQFKNTYVARTHESCGDFFQRQRHLSYWHSHIQHGELNCTWVLCNHVPWHRRSFQGGSCRLVTCECIAETASRRPGHLWRQLAMNAPMRFENTRVWWIKTCKPYNFSCENRHPQPDVAFGTTKVAMSSALTLELTGKHSTLLNWLLAASKKVFHPSHHSSYKSEIFPQTQSATPQAPLLDEPHGLGDRGGNTNSVVNKRSHGASLATTFFSSADCHCRRWQEAYHRKGRQRETVLVQVWA